MLRISQAQATEDSEGTRDLDVPQKGSAYSREVGDLLQTELGDLYAAIAIAVPVAFVLKALWQ